MLVKKVSFRALLGFAYTITYFFGISFAGFTGKFPRFKPAIVARSAGRRAIRVSTGIALVARFAFVVTPIPKISVFTTPAGVTDI